MRFKVAFADLGSSRDLSDNIFDAFQIFVVILYGMRTLMSTTHDMKYSHVSSKMRIKL